MYCTVLKTDGQVHITLLKCFVQALGSSIWDDFRDMVSFVQFEKREKQAWSSTPIWVFFAFLKLCKTDHKSRKASELIILKLSLKFNYN